MIDKNLRQHFRIAKNSPVPLYYQLKSAILELFENGYYKPGDKLPSIKDLARKYEVSTNTIRKALLSLEQDGFITFGRGRFGGTFVIEKPEGTEKQSYQWLSINPNYI